MRRISLVLMFVLAGCVSTVEGPRPGQPAPTQPAASEIETPTAAEVQRFQSVVARVEPVAERLCRQQAPNLNCDFRIVVDDRPNQPANAYQSLDDNGRPVLAFNLAMIAEVRNRDELAFVMGHEAAHHIEGHLPRKQQNAAAGALLLGGLAAITGASSNVIDSAVDIGGAVGARTYSKDYELEADALGTVITRRAGYDPVRGAEFFTRIPDPGDRFLGTHPPNAQRIDTVRRVNAGL